MTTTQKPQEIQWWDRGSKWAPHKYKPDTWYLYHIVHKHNRITETNCSW